MDMYDVIVVGSGVAGLTAGMYAARYQLKTVVVGKELGGETSTAWIIANYPGFKQIDGFELVERMKDQTESAGVKVVDAEVVSASHTGHCFELQTEQKTWQTKVIILTDGTLRRHLNLTKEKELTGKGIHYCATCDAPLYKGKTIAIVGGGDSAVKGANLAKQHVAKVYLIVRESQLHGEPVNLSDLKNANNVEVIYNTSVAELIGQEKLEKIKLSQPYQGTNELTIDGLFIEIGAAPNVKLAKQLGCQLDNKGYIQVDSMMHTSVDGVMAAGDSTNFFGSFKQIVTAAAMGAVAATSAYQDLNIHTAACNLHAKVPNT